MHTKILLYINTETTSREKRLQIVKSKEKTSIFSLKSNLNQGIKQGVKVNSISEKNLVLLYTFLGLVYIFSPKMSCTTMFHKEIIHKDFLISANEKATNSDYLNVTTIQ